MDHQDIPTISPGKKKSVTFSPKVKVWRLPPYEVELRKRRADQKQREQKKLGQHFGTYKPKETWLSSQEAGRDPRNPTRSVLAPYLVKVVAKGFHPHGVEVRKPAAFTGGKREDIRSLPIISQVAWRRDIRDSANRYEAWRRDSIRESANAITTTTTTTTTEEVTLREEVNSSVRARRDTRDDHSAFLAWRAERDSILRDNRNWVERNASLYDKASPSVLGKRSAEQAGLDQSAGVLPFAVWEKDKRDRHLSKKQRCSGVFRSFFTMAATVVKATASAVGSTLAVIGRRFKANHDRVSDPKPLTVQRLKRQVCIPPDTTPEVDVNVDPLFGWSSPDFCQNIGRDKIEWVQRYLEIQEDRINKRQVVFRENPKDLAAALPLQRHGELPLNYAIHRLMMLHYGVANARTWIAACNDYCQGIKQVIGFITHFYMEPRLYESYTKDYPVPPRSLKIAEYDSWQKILLRETSNFLGWMLRLNDIHFNCPDMQIALAKILVDANALNKSEIAPSMVTYTGQNSTNTPGILPDHVIYETIDIDLLYIIAAEEDRFPNVGNQGNCSTDDDHQTALQGDGRAILERPSGVLGGTNEWTERTDASPNLDNPHKKRRFAFQSPLAAFNYPKSLPTKRLGLQVTERDRTLQDPDLPPALFTPFKKTRRVLFDSPANKVYEVERYLTPPPKPGSEWEVDLPDAVVNDGEALDAVADEYEILRERLSAKHPEDRLLYFNSPYGRKLKLAADLKWDRDFQALKRLRKWYDKDEAVERLAAQKKAEEEARRLIKDPAMDQHPSVGAWPDYKEPKTEDESASNDESPSNAHSKNNQNKQSEIDASAATDDQAEIDAQLAADAQLANEKQPARGTQSLTRDVSCDPTTKVITDPWTNFDETATNWLKSLSLDDKPRKPVKKEPSPVKVATPATDDDDFQPVIELGVKFRRELDLWDLEVNDQYEVVYKDAQLRQWEFEDELKRLTFGMDDQWQIAHIRHDLFKKYDSKRLEAKAYIATLIKTQREKHLAEKREKRLLETRLAAEAEKERIRQEQEERKAQIAAEEARRRGLRPPKGILIDALDDYQEGTVNDIFTRGEHVVQSHNLEGSAMTRRDFDMLVSPQGWLNDTVIVGGVLMASQVANNLAGATPENPTCVAFNSFFYNRLVSHGPGSLKRLMRRGSVSPENFLSIETILVPINAGLHWTLAAVRPKLRTICHMDSMRAGAGDDTVIANLQKWVEATLGDQYVAADWRTDIQFACPLQTNVWDCGVFTITNALCLALGLDPMASYSADQLTLQRRRIAATFLNGGYAGKGFALDHI